MAQLILFSTGEIVSAMLPEKFVHPFAADGSNFAKIGRLVRKTKLQKSCRKGGTVVDKKKRKPLQALRRNGFEMVHLQGLEPWTP